MSPTPNRLQIATKIHYFLLRELGQGIHVEQMLKQPSYARDVLLVCEACKGSDLARLAAQFRQAGGGDAPLPPHSAASRSSSPPSATWSPTA